MLTQFTTKAVALLAALWVAPAAMAQGIPPGPPPAPQPAPAPQPTPASAPASAAAAAAPAPSATSIDPYRQIDYTAYTLGKGETRLGVMSVDVAPVKDLQIGTQPLLDLLGIYNVRAKGRIIDGEVGGLAVTGSVMAVPVTDLLKQIGGRNAFGVGRRVFVDSLIYSSLGVLGSVKAHEKFSLHGGVNYLRATGRGQFDFTDLPVVVVPGGDEFGGEAIIVPKLAADLISFRLAADARITHVHSVVLQTNVPVFASATGTVGGGLDGLPEEIEDFDVALSYGRALLPSEAYRASLSYQATIKQVDLRVGFGLSGLDKPLHRSWIVEAFDLAYRFGGKYAKSP